MCFLITNSIAAKDNRRLGTNLMDNSLGSYDSFFAKYSGQRQK